MTNRDRLIELLSKTHTETGGFKRKTRLHDEYIADYLLANGVIVPPCKVGDKVYYIHETYWDKDYKNQVINDNVRNRILKIVERQNHATNLALEVIHFDYCFIIDWIKGNIFLTKEEAEEKLKEREG